MNFLTQLLGMDIMKLTGVLFWDFRWGLWQGAMGSPSLLSTNALDSVLIPVLIPVIHSRGRKRGDEPIVMELIFYILENIT